jgi:hypothetical protein
MNGIESAGACLENEASRLAAGLPMPPPKMGAGASIGPSQLISHEREEINLF